MPNDEDLRIVAHAVLRTAEILAATNDELAGILDVRADEPSRLAADRAQLQDGPYTLALMFIRAAESLMAIVGNGNDQSERSWLRSVNIALKGKPIELMQTPDGLSNGMDYVETRRYRL
jgi:hypothetical protein